jgi:hypothetical protein
MSSAASAESVAEPRRSALGAVAARVEARPVLAVFALALAVRALAAVIITVGWGGTLFSDDSAYSNLSEAAANGTLHQLGDYYEWLYTRAGTLTVPVTALYEVLGPVKLAGQLYVALFGAATAALTTRLALEIAGWRWAVLAGLLVALIPSQVLWSSIVLKDPVVWAILAALAVLSAIATRSTGRRLALAGLTATVLVCLLGFVRLHTMEIAVVALFVAMLLGVRRQWLPRVAGAAALLVCVPLVYGMGPAGWSYVKTAGGNVTYQRTVNAIEANSAVVDPTPPPASAGAPTAGGSAPESAPPPPPPEDTGARAQLSYLPTGVTVVALRPWPWESAGGGIGIRLARAESLLWYPLVLLALVGLVTAWPARRVLAFPILAAAATLVTYGLTEGNLGTAFRHRGEVVWVVALLAALGVGRLWTWAVAHRPSVAVADR